MSLHPNSELGCNICSMLLENTLSIDNTPRHRWLHFGHEAMRIKVTQARLHFRRPPYGSSLILAFRADPLIYETHVLLCTISFFPCFPSILICGLEEDVRGCGQGELVGERVVRLGCIEHDGGCGTGMLLVLWQNGHSIFWG
jgi:hypothetical protein